MINSAIFCLATISLPETVISDSGYAPSWSTIPPNKTFRIAADPQSSEVSNGKRLRQAIEKLQPGERLEIGSGTFSVVGLWDLSISGTAQAPVWITAAKGAHVVVTRPDAKQNILNIGHRSPVQHLAIRGIEFTGGSHGIRIGKCSNVWIDKCHIHNTGEVCLSANSADTSRLYLTGNEIHDGGGTAEGMYLGGNHGKVIMSESVIAKNHVYNCKGSQGDGIEVKQGSWGNLIAANKVHDCNYPCITVYGTAGERQNIIEGNLCFRSNDNAMQVQGEAIVRNNVIISGKNSAFASTDHQAKTTNLQVIHNTIVNANHALRGNSWNGRRNMVLANNVIYSQKGNALLFPNGADAATIEGNVVWGDGAKFGSRVGRGFVDFAHLKLDAGKQSIESLDATPTKDAPFDYGVSDFHLRTDFNGKARQASRIICGALLP
ncbi:MAG: right-handed parallel beta-helix repeat-containing protein [Aureliella sp.]